MPAKLFWSINPRLYRLLLSRVASLGPFSPAPVAVVLSDTFFDSCSSYNGRFTTHWSANLLLDRTAVSLHKVDWKLCDSSTQQRGWLVSWCVIVQWGMGAEKPLVSDSIFMGAFFVWAVDWANKVSSMSIISLASSKTEMLILRGLLLWGSGGLERVKPSLSSKKGCGNPEPLTTIALLWQWAGLNGDEILSSSDGLKQTSFGDCDSSEG